MENGFTRPAVKRICFSRRGLAGGRALLGGGDLTKTANQEQATLEDLRERAGVKQAEVARFCGVTRGAVSRWEAGERTMTLRHLGRLSRLYGVSPAAIMAAWHATATTAAKSKKGGSTNGRKKQRGRDRA